MTKETEAPVELTEEDLEQSGGAHFPNLTLKRGYIVTSDLQDWAVAPSGADAKTAEFQDGDDLFLRTSTPLKQPS